DIAETKGNSGDATCSAAEQGPCQWIERKFGSSGGWKTYGVGCSYNTLPQYQAYDYKAMCNELVIESVDDQEEDVNVVEDPAKIEGDVDGDGDVDFDDFFLLADQFGGSGSADFDNSGTVDEDDFLELAGNFGAVTEEPIALLECNYYYWFDDSQTTCEYKQFCGQYMYNGLQTFETRSECTTAANTPTISPVQPTTTCNNYYWIDNNNKNCEYKEFCGQYVYQSLRTFETEQECKDGLPTLCYAVYEPVCGSDGKTYSNNCYAKVAGITVAYNGICVRTSGLVVSAPVASVGITIPVILDLDCGVTCVQKRGNEMGTCSSNLYEDLLKDHIKIRNWIIFKNENCPQGTNCYCYNPSEQEIIPVVMRDIEINGECSSDESCESGFCKYDSSRGAEICVEGCSHLGIGIAQCSGECMWLGSASAPGGVCINRNGRQKLLDLMPRYLNGHVSDRAEALRDAVQIIEDYHINYGEYLEGMRTIVSNLGLQNQITIPTFNLIKISGNAVNVNTRLEKCPDFDSNGKVDFDDFFMFVDVFGQNVDSLNNKFDLNMDIYNTIGFGDFFRFADNFGEDVSCYSSNQEYTISKREGTCDANGICSYKFNVKARYPGDGDKLNVLMGENSKEITINFAESNGQAGGAGWTSYAIKELTSSTIKDVTGLAVNNNAQQRSRFDCGLRVNPELCCPVGYISSSDNSRCVVIPIMPTEKLVVTTSVVSADFNNDGAVNFVDFFMFSDNFGEDVEYYSIYDLDGDKDVDFDDFFLFADNFGLVLDVGVSDDTCPLGTTKCADGICKVNCVVPITENRVISCEYKYWFDDSQTICGYKQFCGQYMYQDLRTFNTLDECEAVIDSCVEEGDFIPAEMSNTLQCCEGLIAIDNIFLDTSVHDNPSYISGNCISANGEKICVDETIVGNHNCDDYEFENHCTVPEDCRGCYLEGTNPSWHYQEKCCPGLTRVKDFSSIYEEGICIEGSSFGYHCLKCGDDICDEYEDPCVCPEDCSWNINCVSEGGSLGSKVGTSWIAVFNAITVTSNERECCEGLVPTVPMISTFGERICTRL
ncbi:MAG: hypothetical protein KKG75_03745, partial [Nanoarchaeota archaeon]|nr:hypothetical protein [Nanoarchaeota archaeon]